MMHLLARPINDRLAKGERLAAATIISHQGSTPRTAGTKMLIFSDGSYFGTIGGGLLEGRVIAKAKEILAGNQPARMAFDLTHHDVAAMDMICGGRLDVFLDVLEPDDETRAVFGRWGQAIDAKEPGFLLTLAEGTEEAGFSPCRHYFFSETGASAGTFPYEPELLNEALALGRRSPYLQVLARGDRTILVEPLREAATVYLFGAGHVSLPTAQFAARVGFRVVVLDDRAEFASAQRFPEADRVGVVPDFDRSFADLVITMDSFVVIVTRGHVHDKVVLEQALRTPAGYIGMIGSRRKRNAIYRLLQDEGFTEKDLERVHSPIGLEIAAETPEEIAVSIVAELIQVRARLRS